MLTHTDTNLKVQNIINQHKLNHLKYGWSISKPKTTKKTITLFRQNEPMQQVQITKSEITLIRCHTLKTIDMLMISDIQKIL